MTAHDRRQEQQQQQHDPQLCGTGKALVIRKLRLLCAGIMAMAVILSVVSNIRLLQPPVPYVVLQTEHRNATAPTLAPTFWKKVRIEDLKSRKGWPDEDKDNEKSTLSSVSTSLPTTTTLESSIKNDSGVAVSPLASDAPDPPSTTSCWRQCKSRPNMIIIQGGCCGRGGLNDRTYMFRWLSNLAGYFCARVYYSRKPYQMLSIPHNGGQEISKELMWEDFYSIQYLSDHTRAFVPLTTTDLQRATQEGPSTFSVTTSDKTSANIDAIEMFVKKQQVDTSFNQTLVWHVKSSIYSRWYEEIGENFRHRSKELRRSLPKINPQDKDQCTYIAPNIPSETVSRLTEMVFDRIAPPFLNSTSAVSYGYFHIRRGDATASCHTTLPDLDSFLNCSLQRRDEIRQNFGDVVMLLASDERDQCYRRGVCDLIQQIHGLGCLDLDEIIEKVIQDYVAEPNAEPDQRKRFLNNNYLTFVVGGRVAADPRIKIRLEKRREQNCPRCLDIVQRFAANNTLPIGVTRRNTSSVSSVEPHRGEKEVGVSVLTKPRLHPSIIFTRYEECVKNKSHTL